MERKKVVYHKGIRVDVVEARSDYIDDVQISVLGDKEFIKRPFGEYKDTELISQGYEEICVVNGSLFFNQGTNTYANGIEKSMGVVHENDDPTWNKNLGFYHKGGMLYVYSQEYIKKVINDPEIRGAITGAFGLLNNGIKDISGAYTGEPSRTIYLQKSGRTIVGKKADNTIVMATFDGVTGKTGLTGYETYVLARDILQLRNAVCMDGGGSTFMKYKGMIINSSSRWGVNGIGLYVRKK